MKVKQTGRVNETDALPATEMCQIEFPSDLFLNCAPGIRNEKNARSP